MANSGTRSNEFWATALTEVKRGHLMSKYFLGIAAAIAACLSACASLDAHETSDCSVALEHGADSASYPGTAEEYLQLADCLGHRDPLVRDTFAYERFVDALRNRPPDPAVRRRLAEHLIGNLDTGAEDQLGVLAPFSVLVLAEVARTDRLDPFYTSEERSALVEVGTRYLLSIKDYRGFEPEIGWRHGVAHAADLMLQLALNETLTSADAAKMLAAIRSQIAPDSAHSYTFGESQRLARPVIYLALAGHLSAEEWEKWFSALMADQNDPEWENAYASLAGLSELHNTRQFAMTVLVWTRQSDTPALQPLSDGAEAVLASLP